MQIPAVRTADIQGGGSAAVLGQYVVLTQYDSTVLTQYCTMYCDSTVPVYGQAVLAQYIVPILPLPQPGPLGLGLGLISGRFRVY